MLLAHLTDLHLDHLDGTPYVDDAARRVARELPEGAVVVVTGDIATAPTFPLFLPAFAARLGCRVYFILGNHDAWQGSIEGAQRSARKLSAKHEALTYLPGAGIVPLTERACLVGIDGWYDGRGGRGARRSSMALNDFQYVAELKGLHRERRAEVLEERAHKDARRAREVLGAALAAYEHVVFATHVPPFPEASLAPGGKLSDADALPYYCNITLGWTLSSLAAAHPDRRITVLAGHCHTAADVQIAANLRCIVGAARYCHPALSGLVDVDRAFGSK